MILSARLIEHVEERIEMLVIDGRQLKNNNGIKVRLLKSKTRNKDWEYFAVK